jgi:hypothetical protein
LPDSFDSIEACWRNAQTLCVRQLVAMRRNVVSVDHVSRVEIPLNSNLTLSINGTSHARHLVVERVQVTLLALVVLGDASQRVSETPAIPL